MKIILLFTIGLVMSAGEPLAQPRSRAQTGSSCAVIEAALEAARAMTPGLTRAQVDKIFVRDGGVQFAGKTRYLYSGCSLIHIDVEFDVKASPGHLTSPQDVVITTSKLYIEYPAKD
jgi:hypothetical protein